VPIVDGLHFLDFLLFDLGLSSDYFESDVVKFLDYCSSDGLDRHFS
jgi:hypothetical protein